MARHPHRLEMKVALTPRGRLVLPGARQPQAGDVAALAELMFTAYQGTVDYTGESVEAARLEVEKTFAGGYGCFMPECSIVVERENTIACAALVTHSRELPLLAFVMTAPAWKRQGLARAAISHVMQALHQAGQKELALALNAKNEAAKRLYRELGFQPV